MIAPTTFAPRETEERDWALSVLAQVAERIRERGIAPSLDADMWQMLEDSGWVTVTAWSDTAYIPKGAYQRSQPARRIAVGVALTQAGREALL